MAIICSYELRIASVVAWLVLAFLKAVTYTYVNQFEKVETFIVDIMYLFNVDMYICIKNNVAIDHLMSNSKKPQHNSSMTIVLHI